MERLEKSEEKEKLVRREEAATKSPEVRLDALTEAAKKVQSALEDDATNGAKALEVLDLKGDTEAEALSEAYESRVAQLTVKVKELVAMTSLASGLLFASPSFAQESPHQTNEFDDEVMEETQAEEKQEVAAPVASERKVELPEVAELGKPIAETAPEKLQEEKLSNESSEMRELQESIGKVVRACMGNEQGACLKEVVGVTATMAIKNAIPFRSGLSSIQESFQNEKMTGGERVLEFLKGAAKVLRDAALFSSGAGIAKFAQLYRVAGLATDAKDAVQFYAKNKPAVDNFIAQMFKGNEKNRVLVQQKINQDLEQKTGG